jgi:hypothetical protein
MEDEEKGMRNWGERGVQCDLAAVSATRKHNSPCFAVTVAERLEPSPLTFGKCSTRSGRVRPRARRRQRRPRSSLSPMRMCDQYMNVDTRSGR